MYRTYFFFSVFRYDVNLVSFLDYEIWKASYMLAQDVPYKGTQDTCGLNDDLVDFDQITWGKDEVDELINKDEVSNHETSVLKETTN